MVAIEIIGNLGADVKRVEYNGAVFYSINICDNRTVGEKEETTWYTCNLNRVSENLLQYLVKGQAVFVRGIPRYRIFNSAKAHTQMVGIEIFVNEIQLVGGSPTASNNKAFANMLEAVNAKSPQSMEEFGLYVLGYLQANGAANLQKEQQEQAAQGQLAAVPLEAALQEDALRAPKEPDAKTAQQAAQPEKKTNSRRGSRKSDN